MSESSRVTLMIAFALAACSEPDCVSLCEDWVEQECCEKNDLGEGCNDDASQCEKMCEETAEEAKNAGCKKELDAWDACAAELDDICDDTSECIQQDDGEFSCRSGACDEEFEDYLNCISE